MGYKGYIQLAQRTGKYEKIVALPIKEGELISRNEIEEEFNVCLIEDEFEREQAQTIGYYAMIKTTDNFRKAIYDCRFHLTSTLFFRICPLMPFHTELNSNSLTVVT